MTDQRPRQSPEPGGGDASAQQDADVIGEEAGGQAADGLPTLSETQARSLLDQPRCPAFVVPDGVTPLT